MVIDHITIPVNDYEVSKAFYISLLEPLGFELIMDIDGWAGIGRDGKAEFWFGQGTPAPPGLHVAFQAGSRAEVDAFYDAGLKAGGKDNGAPGVRELYHPNYYGAFVIDPNGYNIEAVCHEAPA